jgi:hypothetical protein
MTAYAVSARISRARPRFVPPADGGWPETNGSRTRDADEAPTIVLTQPDDALPGPTPSVAERWRAARERWAQLTFYLLDPESWR